MIYVANTPNNAGVAIYGDCLDFEALYEANIPIMAKRLTEQNDEYYEIRNIVLAGVKEYGCSFDAVRLAGTEYPDEINW